MTTYSDLAPGVHAGFFVIARYGLVVIIEPWDQPIFQGLFEHGGYPPLAPSGQEPEQWSYRAMREFFFACKLILLTA